MRSAVYLAGAVENHPHPEGWRSGIKDSFGYIKFIDPTEEFDEDDTPEVVAEGCKALVRGSDAVLVAYEEEIPTWGTPVECNEAQRLGKKVGVWTTTEEEELPMFLQNQATMVSHNEDELLAHLTSK